MLDSIFLRILDMTATGSLVILAVMLARLLLKKAPKVFSYALWITVVAAVVCVILGVCLLTDPVKEEEHTAETVPQETTGAQMEAVTEGERLAPGVYIPTGYLYTNPLSSYYPGNLSEDFRYTVTEDSFITEGILIEDGSYSIEVNWHWQTLEEAGNQIAFFKGTPYYEQLTGENCRIQPLETGRFLIQNDGRLYLLLGVWGRKPCSISTRWSLRSRK